MCSSDLLTAEIKALEKVVLAQADKLSSARKATASEMNTEVDQILAKLGMKGTTFCVQINQKAGTELEQLCGPYGKDDIEFMISANPGNPPLPLAKIASGGELSRVMLALKTIFARTDNVETASACSIRRTPASSSTSVRGARHTRRTSTFPAALI